MNLNVVDQLIGARPVSALRSYYQAVERAIHLRLYKGLSSLTATEIEQALSNSEDIVFTHPVFKKDMRLTAISVGGDNNDVTLEFTDVTLGVEYWPLSMQQVDAKELISLVEAVQTIKFI